MHTWNYTYENPNTQENETIRQYFEDTFDGREYYIHHNGDYSGAIKIRVLAKDITERQIFEEEYAHVDIPFKVIRDFVLEALRAKAIEKLENASYEDLWNNGNL
jgi:hypothetical protein